MGNPEYARSPRLVGLSADEGLFGPDSLTWKVIGHPVAFVGGLRALIIGALHPLVAAGTVEHSDYRARPLDRLRQTSLYVNSTVFGDTDTAVAAARAVGRAHRKVRGTDPITGSQYDADDPNMQLWVHCVTWHSYMAAYRAYAGRLTDDEQDRYLAEGVRAASLLNIGPSEVPTSVEEQREYWAMMRPRLCVGEYGRELVDFVLNPTLPLELLPFAIPYRVLVRMAIALIPSHLRELASIDRSRVVDALAIGVGRPMVASIALPGPRHALRALFGAQARDLRTAVRADSDRASA